MKKILFAICLSLVACEHKEEEKPRVHREAPPPPPPPAPIPTSTNPFDKPPAPVAPVHAPFQTPHWVQVGEFKMNDNWSIWTWRDDANHNTCYFYNVIVNGAVVGHGVSCVKE